MIPSSMLDIWQLLQLGTFNRSRSMACTRL